MSTSSQWEHDSPDIWPMETEVGGPSRCEAQVLELWGGCYTASAKQDAGKEVDSADLTLASSRAWQRGRGGLRSLWSFSWEAGEDSLRESPLGVCDALEAVL